MKDHILTHAEYHQVRESLGSQRDVAERLGVDIRTVQRREAGEIIITYEATRALLSLCAINLIEDMVVNNDVRAVLNKVLALLEAK